MKGKTSDGNVLLKHMTRLYKNLAKAAEAHLRILRLAERRHAEWVRKVQSKAGHC